MPIIDYETGQLGGRKDESLEIPSYPPCIMVPTVGIPEHFPQVMEVFTPKYPNGVAIHCKPRQDKAAILYARILPAGPAYRLLY